MGDIEMIFIKALSFFEYYYNCKRLKLVPKAVSLNCKIENILETEMETFIKNLIYQKNNIVHEAKFSKNYKINAGEIILDNIIVKNKEECLMILKIFEKLIEDCLKEGEI